jgi:hypothetical protein
MERLIKMSKTWVCIGLLALFLILGTGLTIADDHRYVQAGPYNISYDNITPPADYTVKVNTGLVWAYVTYVGKYVPGFGDYETVIGVGGISGYEYLEKDLPSYVTTGLVEKIGITKESITMHPGQIIDGRPGIYSEAVGTNSRNIWHFAYILDSHTIVQCFSVNYTQYSSLKDSLHTIKTGS